MKSIITPRPTTKAAATSTGAKLSDMLLYLRESASGGEHPPGGRPRDVGPCRFLAGVATTAVVRPSLLSASLPRSDIAY
ncbi:hypothetical protein NL676_021451 [Syzygium grande]|nr:hypothetical protein NL676_021451 [Syzygium grande]